jgi:cell division protein FtsB
VAARPREPAPPQPPEEQPEAGGWLAQERALVAARSVRWDRVGRALLLLLVVVLLYLYVTPVRSLISSVHQLGARRAQLAGLQHEHARLAGQVAALKQATTLESEARNLTLVKQGEHPYAVTGLPNN